MSNIKSASIIAQNTFTDWLKFSQIGEDHFTIIIAGTFVATVTLQIRKPGSSDIVDDSTFTAPAVRNGDLSGAYEVRVGVKTGDFTSGTVEVTINR